MTGTGLQAGVSDSTSGALPFLMAGGGEEREKAAVGMSRCDDGGQDELAGVGELCEGVGGEHTAPDDEFLAWLLRGAGRS